MASNFTHFLISFGEDPQQLEAFKQDPHAVLDAAGLTPAEKTLLLSGNVQLIREALVADPGHKEAMGLPPDQSLPAISPVFIYIPGVIAGETVTRLAGETVTPTPLYRCPDCEGAPQCPNGPEEQVVDFYDRKNPPTCSKGHRMKRV